MQRVTRQKLHTDDKKTEFTAPRMNSVGKMATGITLQDREDYSATEV